MRTHYLFMTEMETGTKFRCAICRSIIDEGYALLPDNDEEHDVLLQKLGDESNWMAGECCFGGYCGAYPASTPTMFFEEVIKKLPIKRCDF